MHPHSWSCIFSDIALRLDSLGLRHLKATFGVLASDCFLLIVASNLTPCLGLCLELCALGLHPRLSSNKSASFFIAITVLVIPVLVFIINQLSFVILLLTNENEPALPDVGSLGLVLKLSLEYCLSLMKLSLVYVYRVYNHCKVRCFLKHFTKLPLLVYPLIPPVTFHRE